MKRIISMIMIMTMVIGITMPTTPGFAVTYEEGSGYYTPEQLPGNLGISRNAMVDLKEVMKDYLLWRGETKSEGVDYFWDNVLTTALKNDLSNNEIDKITLGDSFNTLYGEVTLDQTIEEIFNGLEELTSDFNIVYDNINSNYVVDGITTSDSKVATYIYYAMSAMQEKKIIQPDGNTIKFVFNDTSSNLTDTLMSRNQSVVIKDYIELAIEDQITFDLGTLETNLNTELEAFIASGEVTALEVKNLATEFGVLLEEESTETESSSGGGSSSGGSSGGTTTTPTDDGVMDDEGLNNDSEIAQEKLSDPNASAEEIIKAVNNLTQTASSLIDVNDVNGEEAAAIVKKVVEETIAKAIASDQTSKREKNQLKKTARILAEKAAVKAGTVNVMDGTVVTKDLIEEAVKKAKTAIESLEETLSDSGLSNPKRPMKATVTLKSETENSVVSLSADVIASLKGQNSNLAIGTRGSSILVPSETLGGIEINETIEFSSKAISNSLNAGLNNQVGEEYKFIKTRDIVVSKRKTDGTTEELTTLLLSFDLSDYNGDSNQLAVLVRNSTTEQFELIKSWVVDGQLQFKSPHYSYYTLTEYTPGFNDISNHWAKGVINKMAAKGIVNGKTDAIFDPQGEITRAEFITMLMNAFDYEATITTSFNDANTNHWFYEAVNEGKALGLVNGTGENEFNPNASITRQDMVVMMARFYEEETGERLVALEDGFSDSSKASGYARYYINGAKEVDIVSGDSEGFRPLNNATRAEALKMINNLMIYLK